MPMATHMPVPMSMIEGPMRTAEAPGWPVTLISPPKACIRGS